MISSHSIPVSNKVLSASIITEKHQWQSFEGQPDLLSKKKGDFMPFHEVKNGNPTKAEYVPVDIEQLKRECYQQGFVDGEKSGFEQGAQQTNISLQPNLKIFNNVVQALQQEKDSFYQENELYITKLAIAIAKKIIQRELMQDPEILLYIVREALKRITDNGRIVIRANPADIQLLKNTIDDMQDQYAVFNAVDFLPSDDIKRGGCVIESESGIIDAQLDVQLERIEQLLLEGVQP